MADIPNSTVTKLSEKEFPLWNEFVMDSPQGNFFYTSDWLNAVKKSTGRNFSILALAENSRIRIGLVFLENNRFGLKLVTPHTLLPVNGILTDKRNDEKSHRYYSKYLDFTRSMADYLKKNYNYCRLNFDGDFKDLRSFQWQGFQLNPTYTYRISGETEQDLQNNFNQSLRKKIKSARKSEIKMIELDDITAFCDLYENSYKRHGIKPPLSIKDLIGFLKIIKSQESMHIFGAVHQGNLLAARVMLIYQNKITDFLAGSTDPQGTASSYLLSEILGTYIPRGYKFDFMGADHPEIEKFKRSFGGKLHSGFSVEMNAKFPVSMAIRYQKMKNRLERTL